MVTGYFFPTVINSEENVELAQKMLPIAKEFLQNESLLTYEWGYKNTYNSKKMGDDENREKIKPFLDYVKEKSIEYLESNDYDHKKINFKNIQVFVSEMFENDSHDQHTHPNCILSGLMYLQVPENSSKILFLDPRPYKSIIELPKKKESYLNSHSIWFDPKPGLFLMWESWLPHAVPKNCSKQGRITMVYNVMGTW